MPEKISRFRLDWSDFLDPWCFWIHPHGLERALLAMSYLVRTGYRYQEYGRYGPLDCLYGTGTRGMTSCPVINSLDHLRRNFQRALLDRHTSGLDEWREKYRIGVGKIATIPGLHYEPMHPPHFKCEADAQDKFGALLGMADVKLNVGLNPCHRRGARWVHRIICRFCREGKISFVMGYGYRRDSSEWNHVLATQTNEPPLDVLRRAIDVLAGMVLVKGQTT